MSKAVLVIDMPKNCRECDIIFRDDYTDWCPWKKSPSDVYQYVENNTKPDWCPLKFLPEEDNDDHLSEWARGYQAGWNDCIKAIL